MNKFIYVLITAVTLSALLSCQRGASDVILRPNTDSSISAYRLSGFQFYGQGPLYNNESSIATIQYRDSTKEISIESADERGEVNGSVLKYDNSGRWISEKVLRNNIFVWTNTVNRTASGQLLNFTYTENVGPGPGNFVSPFVYKTTGSSTSITFIDTAYKMYPPNNYYTAFFDSHGNIARAEYREYNGVRTYTYDSENSLVKTVESDSVFSTFSGTVIDSNFITYERDPGGNTVLYDFYKTIKGTDLSWFEHDKYYYFGLMNIGFFFSVGKPCTKITEHKKTYHNRILTYEVNDVYTFDLIYDDNHNLTQYLQKKNGVPDEKWMFTYQKL